jgi:hypothetical protein
VEQREAKIPSKLHSQATNWMRAMAEQNLSQSRAVFEGFLTFTRNALRSIDQQSSAICEHSMAIAEQTLSIAFEFAHKAIRAREPRNSPKSRANSLAGRPLQPQPFPEKRPAFITSAGLQSFGKGAIITGEYWAVCVRS